MEKYEVIIQKGKISDLTFRLCVWGFPSLVLLTSSWAFYNIRLEARMNASSGQVDYLKNNTSFFVSLFLVVMMLFCLLVLFRGERILKTVFYSNVKSNINKENIIKELRKKNKWSLKKEDTNYYRFLEFNSWTASYYITIVYDEKGFYINCYPYMNRVIDFGGCKKRSEEICECIGELS